MFISQFKNHKKIGLLAITNYLVWGFLVLTIVFFSWLFLFIYRHIYAAIVQEIAIANLKSQLVVTKVNKTKFDDLIKKFEAKQTPSVTINFGGLKNPFKSETAPETKKK